MANVITTEFWVGFSYVPMGEKYILSYSDQLVTRVSKTDHDKVSSNMLFEYALQYTSEYVLKYTPGHALQDTPHCVRWHTPSLLDYMLPSKLWWCSQLHSWARSQVHSQLHSMTHSQPAWLYAPKYALKTLSITLPIALDDTLPAYLTIHSEVSSQDALNHTPKHALKYTPNYTRWHTPSLLNCTLWSKLWRHSQEHLWLHSQVHLPVAYQYTLKRENTPNCTWVYAPMYAPACSIQRLAELQTPGIARHEANGIWWASCRGRWATGGMWCVVHGRS